MLKDVWFWVSMILIAFILISLMIANNVIKIDGRKGGLLYGLSHKLGGIKAWVKGSSELVEVEGGEDILAKGVTKIKDNYMCEGTPEGIASAINELGGGIKFSEGGKCYKK